MASRQHKSDPDVKLSKTLSYLLRHGGEKEGFNFISGGFLYVSDILTFKNLRGFSEADVRRVVETNSKKRFELQDDDSGKLLIRAVQGHSVQVDDLDLEEIKSPADLPVVAHATNKKAWQSISRQGIHRMSRNHIHLAPTLEESHDSIQYFRKSSNILIKIDVVKAMADGIKFFRAANGVLLSSGNSDGYLLPLYFESVFDRKTGARLL